MDAIRDAFATEFGAFGDPRILVVLARMVGATVLCAVIGFEREARDQAAGLRTNMLVGLAAATYAAIAAFILAGAETENVRIDPLRLIEAVTGGAAFLAAGLIVLARGRVRGLTTGATVWLCAAVGLAVGVGHWLVGIAATVIGLLVLTLMRQLERALGLSESGRHGAAPAGDDTKRR